MPQKHSIGSVTVQVRASRQVDGFGLQQEISKWFWDEFLPVLDELLSELAPAGELIRLDQLDLQLPVLSPVRWREEITAAITGSLREKLGQLLRYSGAADIGLVERVPLVQGHFEAWLWYLEHGQLPVHYANTEEEERLQAVLENVAGQTDALHRLLVLLRQSPTAIQRLALQHRSAFLSQLSTAITGQAMGVLADQPAVLHALLTGAPLRALQQRVGLLKAGVSPTTLPARQVEIRFWQHVFETLAADAQSFDIQNFTAHFFETKFTHLFPLSFQAALEAARQAETGDAGNTAIGNGREQKIPGKTPFATWLWLLEHGRLPADRAPGSLPDRLAAVLETISRQPDAVRQLSRLLRHRSKALQRLVLEHDLHFLTLLTGAITGKSAAEFSALPAVFYKALTGRVMQGLAKQALPQTEDFNASVVPLTSFELWFWQELLIAAATDLQEFDIQVFSNTFFKQAFTLIYKIAYTELIEQILRTAATSKKQRTETLRRLEQLQRQFAGANLLQVFFQQEIEPLQIQLSAAAQPDPPVLIAAATASGPTAAPAGHFTAWMWFLQNGHFPSGYTPGEVQETVRLHAVLEAVSTRTTALQALRRLLLRQPIVLERLVLQHPPDFLTDLALLLTRQPLLHLPEQARMMYAFLSGIPMQDLVRNALPPNDHCTPGPVVARQLELWFWQELLTALAGKAKELDYQLFIREFFYWSFQRVFQVAFDEWVQRATSLAAAAKKKRGILQRLSAVVSRQLAGNELWQQYLSQCLEPALDRLYNPLILTAKADADGNSRLIVSPESDPSVVTGTGIMGETSTLLSTRPGLPTDSHKSPEKPASIVPEVQYLQHAGLVLLHPFLGALFAATGMTKEHEFIDDEAQTRAVQLLHYLATGSEDAPEYLLGMPKFLCGMPHDMPVDRQSLLREQDIEEGEAMLQAVIQHWEALGQVSNDSLREGFLQREGKLSRRNDEWLLQVESKTLDILLDRLPWGINMVQLPWIRELLQVEWH